MSYKELDADPILGEFPGLTQAELDAVDQLFANRYILIRREDAGRTAWATCCHAEDANIDAPKRVETEASRALRAASHNAEVECPYCGRTVTVKHLHRIKRLEKLGEFHPVLFLRASDDGQTVYAQGYWAHQDLVDRPTGEIYYMVTSVYRFRPGETMQWDRDNYAPRQWTMRLVEKARINEPFTAGSGLWYKYCDYDVVGLAELQRSFLRHACYQFASQEGRQTDKLIRYLDLAAHYPRNVEMLVKAGMTDVILDYIYGRGKKNADCIRWGETDPRKALGLTKQELKRFLQSSRDIEILRVYKMMRRGGNGDMECAITAVDRFGVGLAKRIAKAAARHQAPMKKLLRYLDDACGARCHGGGVTRQFAATQWVDYTEAAEQIGYDLTNPLIMMPRDLRTAHDTATEAAGAKASEEERKKILKRHQTLQKRYGYERGRYFIRAPLSADEIIEEGAELKHCVGGYAKRHANGAVTILFLRDKARPNVPLVTIEMEGNSIRQVNGYKNDVAPCPGNPKAKPARTLYAEILNPWLDWVKAGSRRDKNGDPITPQKKRDAALSASA